MLQPAIGIPPPLVTSSGAAGVAGPESHPRGVRIAYRRAARPALRSAQDYPDLPTIVGGWRECTEYAPDLGTGPDSRSRRDAEASRVRRPVLSLSMILSLSRRRARTGLLTSRRVSLTLGCQRSGTTLLHLILDQHPEIASLDEPHSYEYLRRGRMRHRRAGRASLINLKLPQMGYEPASRVISDLLLAGAPGVYLFRDPRAVAASMIRFSRGRGTWAEVCTVPEVAALSRECGEAIPCGYDRWSSWRKCLHHINLKHSFYRAYLAKSTLPLCYERLVEEPERCLRRIVAHLGLAFHPALMRHHVGGTGTAVGGTRRDRPIDRESVGAWRNSLTPGQISDVETICAGALAYWDAGYGSDVTESRLSVAPDR